MTNAKSVVMSVLISVSNTVELNLELDRLGQDAAGGGISLRNSSRSDLVYIDRYSYPSR